MDAVVSEFLNKGPVHATARSHTVLFKIIYRKISPAESNIHFKIRDFNKKYQKMIKKMKAVFANLHYRRRFSAHFFAKF